MIIRLRRAVERDAQTFPPIRWKGGGKNRVALDHPGIAIRGTLPRPRAIDQRDCQTSFHQMNGDRGANNAGTKNNDISTRHGTSTLTAAGKPCRSPAGARKTGKRRPAKPATRCSPGNSVLRERL